MTGAVASPLTTVLTAGVPFTGFLGTTPGRARLGRGGAPMGGGDVTGGGASSVGL